MTDPLSSNFEKNENLLNADNEEDLFISIYEQCDKHKHEKCNDREDDIFTEANEYFEDVLIDQYPVSKDPLSDERSLVQISDSQSSITNDKLTSNDGAKYFIDINVKDPKKIGDGLNTYVVYRILTSTNIPDYQHEHMEVSRRFSDFLHLHSKLIDKYKQHGTIIPSPPQKNAIGTTKVKISRDEATAIDFIEHRRVALERFLRCIARHPTLRTDPNVVDFLELEGVLPRSTSSSAMTSSSRVIRFINRVGENLSKMTMYKMEDAEESSATSEWFEDKQQQIELMESHLRSMYNNIEELHSHRKELSQNAISLSKSIDWLSTIEEHASLSRALSSLAEIQIESGSLYANQSNADYYILLQLVNQHLGLCQSAKDSFQERLKLYKLCRDDDAAKKKMMVSQKNNMMTASCGPEQMDQHGSHGNEYEQASCNIMREVRWMDGMRSDDFKEDTIKYLQVLLEQQSKLVDMWEAFLPIAQGIL